jgi:hypothetical protein
MKVHVVTIEHKYSTDITVHLTSEGAVARMNEYADEWWEREFPGKAKPADDKIGEVYFDNIDGEYCNIEECEVQS